MQTSRFQLGLIVTLAAGLGAALSSSPAIGYPSGPVVSSGTNPVWAIGGTLPGETRTVLTAPADQDMVVTDVLITIGGGHEKAYLTLADDTLVLSQDVIAGGSVSQPVSHQFSSGIRIPAGTYLNMGTQWDQTLNYAFSGYYAQP